MKQSYLKNEFRTDRNYFPDKCQWHKWGLFCLLLLFSMQMKAINPEHITPTNVKFDASMLQQYGYFEITIPFYDDHNNDEGLVDGYLRLSINNGTPVEMMRFYSWTGEGDPQNQDSWYWIRTKNTGAARVQALHSDGTWRTISTTEYTRADADKYGQGSADMKYRIWVPVNFLNAQFDVQVGLRVDINEDGSSPEWFTSSHSATTTFNTPTVTPALSNNAGKYTLSYSTSTTVPSGSTYRWGSGSTKTASSNGSDEFDINYTSQSVTLTFNYKVSDYQTYTTTRSITVPGYQWPINVTAENVANGNTLLKWDINTVASGDYTAGTFEIQRADNSQFNNAVMLDEQPQFSSTQTSYEVTDKTGDLNLNGTYYYRIRRSHTGSTWQWDYYKEVSLEKNMAHIGIANATVSLDDANIATVKWELEPVEGNSNVWTDSSEIIIIRTNLNTGVKEEITVSKESADAKSYSEKLLQMCNEYEFKIYVKPGSSAYSNTKQVTADPGDEPLIPVNMGTLISFNASKGYYHDRTKLEWSTDGKGTIDNFIIKSRVYNSNSEFVQVANVAGSDAVTNFSYEDTRAVAGVFYEYEIVGAVVCADGTRFTNLLNTYGFRSPTGEIYGRVTFESGQAVIGADVRLSSKEDIGGRSMKLGGTANEYMETDNVLKQTAVSYTMQAYVKPDSQNANGTILKRGDYELGLEAGTPFFKVGQVTVKGDETLKNSTFTHLSGVYSSDGGQDSIFLYVRTDIMAVYKIKMDAAPAIADRKFIIGKSFAGNIDEVRVWDRALDKTEIERDYNRFLTGNENQLLGYWRFNEPFETEFYDCSYKGVEYNGNHGKIYGNVKPNDAVPTDNQLSFRGVTDNNGNYRITGIPYSGNGTEYTLTPYYGIHQFSPSEKTIVLGTSNSSFDIDFVDRSSFDVSGIVYYENSTVPVSGVMFYIDGQPASRSNGELITSNDAGVFTISVPVGTHEVKAVKQNHTFIDDGKLVNSFGADLNYQDDMVDVRFWDNTKIRLIGKVVGGTIQEAYPVGHSLSTNNLGDEIVLKLRLKERPGDIFIIEDEKGNIAQDRQDVVFNHFHPEYTNEVTYSRSEITIKANVETGEYVADVIPEVYNVTSINVTGYGNLIGEVAKTIDLSSAFMESTSLYPEKPDDTMPQDTVKYNGEFSYRVDINPVFSFEEVTDTITCKAKEFFGSATHSLTIYTDKGNENIDISLYDKDKKEYYFGKPVYKLGGWYYFQVEGFYPYYYNNDNTAKLDKVPVQGGDLTIANTIKSESKTLELDDSGKALYGFQCDNPDINGAMQGLRNVQFSITVNNYTTAAQKHEGYVLGGKPKGQDFVTDGPNDLLMVLRDPPGSRSYAYAEEGLTITKTKGKIKNGFYQEGEEVLEHFFGQELTTSVGLGFETETKVDSENNVGIQLEHHEEGQEDITSTDVITTTTRFQTSDDPLYVGSNGDLLIGNSTNIIIGTIDKIDIKPSNMLNAGDVVVEDFGEYVLYTGNSISIGSKFNTLFAYPQIHIEEVIIPQLQNLIINKLQTDMTPGEAKSKANAEKTPVYLSKILSGDPNFGKPNPGTIITEDGPYYTIFFPDGYTEEKQDTIDVIYNSINNWENLLLENERQKVEAQKVTGDKLQNYSFQAGSNIEHSIQFSYSIETEKTFTFTAGAGLHGQIGATINGFGLRFTAKESAGGIGGHSSGSGETKDQLVGFVLADDGDYDYLSVDVITVGADRNIDDMEGHEDDMVDAEKGGNFIYRLRGGATACPYEGPEYTKYYEPGKHKLSEGSVQVEVPKIEVLPNVVSNVPSNNPAVFTLKLYNESEAKADSWFDLKLVDNTIPDGAKFSIDGVPLSDGRTFLVPSGEILTKTLEVRMGAASYDYKDMQLVLTSQCQCDPTTFQEVIADTITLSAHFIPTSTAVHIKSPGNNWTLNTACDTIAGGKPYLPILIYDYDVNYRDFDRIEVQYKPISESKQWTVLRTFYSDPGKITKPDVEELIGTQTTLTANFFGDEDQRYDIRAVSYCKYGMEEVNYVSETISGIKDTKRPVLFGSAQPADGILDIGDEVQLNFSEDLADGYLTEANFEVKAIKNGATVDHSVSVKLDGDSDYLSTEFEKNFANKSLTVEIWVRPTDINRAGTLFNHGNANEAFEISLTADKRLEVKIGKETYSSRALDMKADEWANVAVVYNTDKAFLTGYYNYVVAIEEGDVPVYNGTGRFEYGRNVNGNNYFAGSMHEARIWEDAVDLADIKSRSLIVLSGMEPSLMACFPMDEAKGTLVLDKARGNNAVLRGEWNTPAGKAVVFNGTNSLLTINSSEIPVRADQSFTMEFWFRSADTQVGNAALINNGKADGNELGTSNNKFFIGFENGKLIFRSKEQTEDIPGNYTDQAWHHFAISVNRNSGNAQVFVDGELRKYFASDKVGGISGARIFMGACQWTEKEAAIDHVEQYFDGQIDEFRLWNSALTQSEINRRGNVKMDGTEMGLMAYYPFEKYIINNANQQELIFTTEELVEKKYQATIAGDITETDNKAPLKFKGPEQAVLHKFVVNKDALIITLTEPEERIEKTIVNFAVKRVRDVNGNEINEVIRWSAYIDRNQLRWNEAEVVKEKMQYEPMSFVVALNNVGGSIKNYTLDKLPAWLTAEPMSGELSPKASQKITFTVNEGVNVGTYNEVIYARGENNVAEPLSLSLKVNGERPDWNVNPADFKYNMSVFGKLRFNNIFSTDKEDLLAVFKGGQCIGVANCTYDRDHDMWYAFLTVYNNETQADGLEFRMWDASTGKIYSATPTQNITFINDRVFGTAKDPVVFDGKEMFFQNVHLVRGWNWISFNLANRNLSNVTATLINGQWGTDDMVKDANNFDSYSTNKQGWVGTLSNNGGFNNTSLFMISSSKDQVLSTNGSAVDTKSTPITVRGNNWNYISYLPSVSLTVKEALAGYDTKEGDILKSQNQFTMYSGTGWIGSLTYMEPGKGYMLFRNSGDNATLVYPSTSGSLSNTRTVAETRGQGEVGAYLNSDYADNMNVVAISENIEPGDRIHTYVNGELRGISETVEATDGNVQFISIAGSDAGGTINFDLERNGEIIARSNTAINYYSNSVRGKLEEPLILKFNKMESNVALYPVPFDTELNIDVVVEEDGKLDISIYDVLGQIILKRSENVYKGIYHTTWNGTNAEGAMCGRGVYLVRITVNGETTVRKIEKK